MGSKLSSTAVAKSFKLKDGALDGGVNGGGTKVFGTADAKHTSDMADWNFRSMLFVVVVIFLLIFFIGRCSECDPKVENCSSTRSGSYGGSSSGGGHK